MAVPQTCPYMGVATLCRGTVSRSQGQWREEDFPAGVGDTRPHHTSANANANTRAISPASAGPAQSIVS